jgi:hypothetical protein
MVAGHVDPMAAIFGVNCEASRARSGQAADDLWRNMAGAWHTSVHDETLFDLAAGGDSARLYAGIIASRKIFAASLAKPARP